MKLCSIASGSSGNCIFAGSETTSLLIDAGISGKRVEAGLAVLDRSAKPGAFADRLLLADQLVERGVRCGRDVGGCGGDGVFGAHRRFLSLGCLVLLLL